MPNLAAQFRTQAQGRWPGATVTARGKTFIHHAHPTEPGRGMVDVLPTGAALHYGALFDQEIDTDWEPSALQPWLFQMVKAAYNVYTMPGNATFDSGQLVKYVDPETGAEIAFQPQQLQWTNNLDQIQAIADVGNVSGSVETDAVTWINAYGLGRHFQYQAQGQRLQKRLILDSVPPAPNATILAGGNPVLRLQFIFQKSAGVEIWLDGQLWNEASNNPITTSNPVEFRVGGMTKWHFAPAFATEADGEEITPVYRFRKQGANLFVEVRTPWPWLETAAYPVVIDPTVDVGISAGDYDAHEGSDGANFSATATVLRAESSTLAANRYFSEGIFVLTGPASGNTIDVAYVTIHAFSTSADDPNVDGACEDVDSAVDFTTNADVTSRVRTTATVQWTTTGIGTGAVNTPSLVAPVQEVIDRAGWVSGANLGVFLDGRSDAAQTFRTVSYEGSATDCWQLHVEYTAGGSPSSSVSPSVSPSASVSPSSSESPSVSPSASVSPSSSESPSISPSASVSPSSSESPSVSPSASVSPSSSESPSVSPSASVSPSSSVSPSVSPSASVSPSRSPSASASPSSSVSPSVSPSASLSPSSSASASPSPSAEDEGLPEIGTYLQPLGLSISVYEPLVQGGTWLFDITQQYETYSHDIQANGGYWSAQVTLNLPLLQAEDWYENGLGRRIVVFDQANVVIWEGFVDQVALRAGALSETRGPLLDVGNRVSAVYTPLDVSVYPPVSGTTTVTTIAEDATSQDKYGILEKVVSAGTTTDDNAEQVRDIYLAENRDPETSGDVALQPGSGQNASVTLDCLGYVHWLMVYIYNNTGTGLGLVSDKIVSILAADPNGIISTNVNEIEANSFLTPVVEDRNRFAWDILKELIALGNDTDDTRRLFGLYAYRVAKYNTQPQTIAYHHRLTDQGQRVTTPQGAIVQPWNVLPGKWLFVPDFLVGRPQASDLALDPRCKFIESVRYDAPMGISISGSKDDSLPQLLAKLTYTGGLL